MNLVRQLDILADTVYIEVIRTYHQILYWGFAQFCSSERGLISRPAAGYWASTLIGKNYYKWVSRKNNKTMKTDYEGGVALTVDGLFYNIP